MSTWDRCCIAFVVGAIFGITAHAYLTGTLFAF